MVDGWQTVRLGNLLKRVKDEIKLEDDTIYKEVTVRLWNKGVILRGEKPGSEIKTKRFRVCAGQLILSRIDVRNGAIGIVPPELDGAVVSGEFWTYAVDKQQIDPRLLALYVSMPRFLEESDRTSSGTTHRIRAEEQNLLQIEIPLPPLPEQQRIVARVGALALRVEEARGLRRAAVEEIEHLLVLVSSKLMENRHCETKPLGEIVDKRTGVAYKSEDFSEEEGVPVIRLKEISTKSVSVYLQNPKEYPNVWVEKGDILLAKTSWSTGTICMWPGPEAVLNQNAVMLRAKQGLDQFFLFKWLQQHIFRFLQDQLADPNYYPYIREKDLMTWQVPIPPLPEQRGIIAYLDDLQAKVDDLRRLQAGTQKELDALMPSILAKAFAGEL